MPFVTENISKNSTPEDWRQREAATLAFGSILDGPSPRTLADIVRQAMGFLLAVRPFSCSMLMMGAVPCPLRAALLHSYAACLHPTYKGMRDPVKMPLPCVYMCLHVCRLSLSLPLLPPQPVPLPCPGSLCSPKSLPLPFSCPVLVCVRRPSRIPTPTYVIRQRGRSVVCLSSSMTPATRTCRSC